MAEETKVEKEVVEAEVVDDKKENGFKKFFGKVKKSVNDSVLEAKKKIIMQVNILPLKHMKKIHYSQENLLEKLLMEL